jgi:hypothetical protein
MFDLVSPVKRKFEGKTIIEGVTTTDQYQIVGYTYWPATGRLVIKNRMNEIRYQGTINSIGDFARALKKADQK